MNKINLQFFAKTIDDYKKDYQEARARGDYAGMQQANDGANAIRRANGEAEQKATTDIANIRNQYGSTSNTSTNRTSTGGTSYGGTTSRKTTSTPSTDLSIQLREALDTNAGLNSVLDLYNQRYDKIKNDSSLEKYYDVNGIMTDALNYINSQYGDVSTKIDKGILSGMSYDEAKRLYDTRYDKATGVRGLEQYADDETMQEILAYMDRKEKQEDYEQRLEEAQEELMRYLNQAKNMKFEYDVYNDPSYLAYKDQYQREGERARQNTLADASSMTGGLANSWALTSSQMANDYYNSKLGDKIPELYNIAYSRFDNERNSLLNQANNYANVYDRLYQGYSDSSNEVNNFIDTYRNDERYQQQFDRSNYESDRAYNFQIEQFDYAKTQDELDRAFKEEQAKIDNMLAKQQLDTATYNAQTNRLEYEYKVKSDMLDREGATANAQTEAQKTEELNLLLADMMRAEDKQKWLDDMTAQGIITAEEYEKLKTYLPESSW